MQVEDELQDELDDVDEVQLSSHDFSDLTTATYKVELFGFDGLPTQANFFTGAAGTVGVPVFNLGQPVNVGSANFPRYVYTGTWTATSGQALTPAIVAQLQAGNLYLQVNSTTYPLGELRGQFSKKRC